MSQRLPCSIEPSQHVIPEHPSRRVTLPWHGKDLKRRTLASIVEQSGYTVEEFLGLL
jgi:hypothetical protein